MRVCVHAWARVMDIDACAAACADAAKTFYIVFTVGAFGAVVAVFLLRLYDAMVRERRRAGGAEAPSSSSSSPPSTNRRLTRTPEGPDVDAIQGRRGSYDERATSATAAAAAAANTFAADNGAADGVDTAPTNGDARLGAGGGGGGGGGGATRTTRATSRRTAATGAAATLAAGARTRASAELDL